MPREPLPAFPLAPSRIPSEDQAPTVRLTGIEKEIWDRALPYLDVRDNDAHTLYAYGLAVTLLDAVPDTHSDVVLPAILLHDTGWKTVDPARILPAIVPGSRQPEIIRRHETEGALITARILADLGHPADLIARVVAIVDGHDSRRHVLSADDAVVKDADKLWRLTPHGLRTIGSWFRLDADQALRLALSTTDSRLTTEPGRAIGRALAALAGLDRSYQALAINGPLPPTADQQG